MTPAIKALERERVPHTVRRYEIAAADDRTYGEAVADALGVAPLRVFKTLIARLDSNELVVAVVPVSGSLNLRALAAAAKAKSAVMAPPEAAERATGYVTGGISPFGQRKRLRTFVDLSVQLHPTVLVSAGRRGLQVEIAPADLLQHTGASTAELARE
jgi:Cys-tRNA(Pro)/Cys-tRNA(Cys) deacylase